MQRAKRVRFIDAVPDDTHSGRFEAAFAPCKSTETPESNDPKTSEFAFFKKFREGSSLKHQPKFSSRGNVQLKCSKRKNYGGNECSTEYGHSTGGKDNNTISNSSFFTENRPGNTKLLLSPQVAGSRRFEQGNKNFTSSSFIKTNGKNDREEILELSPLMITPTSSGTDDLYLERATDSVRSDTYYTDGDLFSKKRAKLQSLVAKTMFTGNNETLTGSDLISLLLNRLQPENFGTNDSKALKSRQNEEDTEYEPDFMPKHEEPYFMDFGASFSCSNKFQLKRLVGSGFPALEYKDRELEPFYFSNIGYNQSWRNNSAETFLKANAEHYGTSRTFNCRRMPVEDEHPWNYRLDNTLSAQGSFFGNADSFTPYMNKNNRFLLEYEEREPECIAEAPSLDTWSSSMFGNSPEKHNRSSELETCTGSDESNDELEYLRFSRKPSDLLPSTTLIHYQQTPEISEVDDDFLEFDSRSNPSLEIFDTGFLLPSSHPFLYPETAHPSSYLLLEGVEDEYKQNRRVKEICYHSTSFLSRSPDIELVEPSQIQKLDWRNNDEEDMYIL